MRSVPLSFGLDVMLVENVKLRENDRLGETSFVGTFLSARGPDHTSAQQCARDSVAGWCKSPAFDHHLQSPPYGTGKGRDIRFGTVE